VTGAEGTGGVGAVLEVGRGSFSPQLGQKCSVGSVSAPQDGQNLKLLGDDNRRRLSASASYSLLNSSEMQSNSL